ncbi:MAG: phosphate ABC transporter permease PstA [Caldisericia bacterium]|nr:phosphate ABC transporter permease PstA [Caldisericia bacterium]
MMNPKTSQSIAWVALSFITFVVMGALLFLVLYCVVHGWNSLNMAFVFGPTTKGGLLAPIVGTIYLIFMTLLFVIPLGVGAAIYLSEYAPVNGITHFIRYALSSLAGIPSIIFGLFGVALFVTLIGHASILAGALTMACLSLPFMVTATEEALKGVPKSWREASLGLGATKWETTWFVVLPSALPGIITGIILCMGRVVAETAPLLATAGFSPFVPTSPFDGARTLALHLFYLATEAPSTGTVTRYDLISQAMGIAVILILIIVLMNGLIRLFSNLYSRRFLKQGV